MTEAQLEYHRRSAGSAHAGWGRTSRFKGVYRRPGGHFAARLRFAGRLYHLGSFVTEIDAARAVAARRAELAAARRHAEGG